MLEGLSFVIVSSVVWCLVSCILDLEVEEAEVEVGSEVESVAEVGSEVDSVAEVEVGVGEEADDSEVDSEVELEVLVILSLS